MSVSAAESEPGSSVIQGEGPESDREDSIQEDISNHIVDGEAPESDDEVASFSLSLKKSNTKKSTNHQFQPSTKLSYQMFNINSILQKKLYEKNLSFWIKLNSFIQSYIAIASKQLLAAEQMLLKSQVTLQAASQTIKKVNDHTNALLNKSKLILTENFLPDITISNSIDS